MSEMGPFLIWKLNHPNWHENIYGKPRKPNSLAPFYKEALDPPPPPQGKKLKDSEWARIYFLPNDYFYRHNDHKLVKRCSQMTTKCAQRHIFMLAWFLVLFYALFFAIRGVGVLYNMYWLQNCGCLEKLHIGIIAETAHIVSFGYNFYEYRVIQQ